MVKFTDYQKKVLREKGLCKVNIRNMWQEMHQLGYCSKGGLQYEVNIAGDCPNSEDVTDIVLLHELGHIFYGHVDQVDQKKEFQDIEQLCKDLGRDFQSIMYVYGGPHDFLNICMDIQINSTILTNGNLEVMKNIGFGLWTPETAKVDMQNALNGKEKGSFRSYYKPLIEIVPPEDEMDAKNKLDILNDIIKQLQESIGNTRPGQGGSDGQSGHGLGPGAGMQDLPSTGNMAFDSELSDAVREAIQEENYTPGNSKKDRNDKVEGPGGKHATVNDMVDANETKNNPVKDGAGDKEDDSVKVPDYSRAGTGVAELEVVHGDPAPAILKLLEDITEVKREYKHDILKHYNRGSRENPDGLMYSSVRGKRNVDKKKLGILVDVSGSMKPESVLKAISSIDAANIDKNSVIAAWDTALTEEYLVSQKPETLRIAGGTDMASGLKYLVNKGMKEIIIYSDFGTDMNSLIEEAEIAKKQNCNLYSIIVARVGEENNMKKAIEGNKAEVVYFHKYCKRNLVIGAND